MLQPVVGRARRDRGETVEPWAGTRRFGRWSMEAGHGTQYRACGIVARLLLLLLLLCGAFAAAPVLAQTPPAPNVPQGSPIPRILPPAPPATAPGSALPALPPPGAEVSEPPRACRQRQRGRGHRLFAAGDHPLYRGPDRAGGAADEDRCGAAGDPAALPLGRLRAQHRVREPRPRRQPALRRHRGPHRQRQAGRRYRARRRAGAALPESPHARCSRSIRLRWSAICCWRRTCRASPCARCCSRPPISPARST